MSLSSLRLSLSRSGRRVVDPRTARVSATLYAYLFFDDFVLLYPVYAVLFARSGLSVAQISALFVIWSVTGFVLEVPAGVWADAVSRRLLLCLGPVLSAVGFGLWVGVRSFWAFAAGFVLWGVQGALQSGALEALVYDALASYGAADQYARVMGRARAFGVAAVLAASALAGSVYATGGYLALGVASVAARLVCGGIALALPEHRAVPGHLAGDPPDDEPALGYVATLRAGLREARGNRPVRRALVLVPAVTAVWGGLEEYDGLLARDTGVAARTVPLLMLVAWVGVAVGGALSGTGQRMRGAAFAGVLALGALALAIGAGSGRPAGFVLVAAAYAVFQMATVVADTRLQERIAGSSRATVTSLAALGTEVVVLALYASYAAASPYLPNRAMFALCAVPYLVVAAAVASAGAGKRGGTVGHLGDLYKPLGGLVEHPLAHSPRVPGRKGQSWAIRQGRELRDLPGSSSQ